MYNRRTPYADENMTKEVLGDDFEEMAEPGNIELDRDNPVTLAVVAALREVYDPEIPVNVYELGLIYKITLIEIEAKSDDGETLHDVDVIMTLTSPGCPVAQEMPEWIRDAILPVKGVAGVTVDIIFDPVWEPSMMAETAKLQLNMF